MIPGPTRQLRDAVLSWVLDDTWRMFGLGLFLFVLGASALVWFGYQLRPADRLDEAPEAAHPEFVEQAMVRDRSRPTRRHRVPPVAHRTPTPQRSPADRALAGALRHRAAHLPTVRGHAAPQGNGLYSSLSAGEDTTVAVDLREDRTAVLPAVGGEHR